MRFNNERNSQLSSPDYRSALISQLSSLVMIFTETSLQGAFVIEAERLEDDRGFFAWTFCQKEFETHGLNPRLV